MKTQIRFLTITLTAILLLLFCQPLSSSSEKQPGKSVFVIVIDGARYSETFGDPSHTFVPRMWEMAKANSSVITSFYNDGITKTVPGHSSIESGVWQKITNNGAERPTAPTFFEYFRSAHPEVDGQRVWVVAGKSKLDVLNCSTSREYGSRFNASYNVPDTSKEERSDIETWNALRSIIRENHPNLVLVNFADVDISGHSGKWDRYVSSIRTADSLVCEVWKELSQDAFYRGNVTLIVTDDHGRHDDKHGGFKNHGDGCEGCRRILFFATGPQIKRGFTSTRRRTQIDICPTVGTLLGFTTPRASGKVTDEIFVKGK